MCNRNRAVFQNEVSKFGKDVSDTGMALSTARVIRAQNAMYSNILNNKYADFGIDEQFMDRYQKGTLTEDDIIKAKATNDPSMQTLITDYETRRQNN